MVSPPSSRRRSTAHRAVELNCSSPLWQNVNMLLQDFRKRCARPVSASSTSRRDASETEGTLPRAKNSPPDCFYGSLRCRRPFESRPANQKRVIPDGITRFWYAGRDSNPQPSEPESDALSIEPPAHFLKPSYYSRLSLVCKEENRNIFLCAWRTTFGEGGCFSCFSVV